MKSTLAETTKIPNSALENRNRAQILLPYRALRTLITYTYCPFKNITSGSDEQKNRKLSLQDIIITTIT